MPDVRLWADVKSPSDAHVIASFVRNMPDVAFTITVRDRAEAIALATAYGLDFRPVGRDSPARVAKIVRYGTRVLQLHRGVPEFDASLSFNNMNAVLLARLRRKASITLMDNDLEFDATKWSIAKRMEMNVNLRADHLLVPDVFPLDAMIRMGARPSSIRTFDGYKEDLYVADFEPDPTFRETIPFDDYVVLRPEARNAVYVRHPHSLVPDLARLLGAAQQNVVYLPRTDSDRSLIPKGMPSIHIPTSPPNGLQLAWHARAVLTGSGSLAREAACLGVPAVSFFPERLLAVDGRMVREGWIMHSRDPLRIVEHVWAVSGRRSMSRERSRRVLQEVVAEVRRCVREGRSSRR